MKTAFVIFDDMTTLDFVGIYDPLTRLKSMNYIEDFTWDVCSFTDTVTDDRGLSIIPDKVKTPLNEYDLLVVPGGYGTKDLQFDQDFMMWIKTSEPVKLKTSVCTGSLLLGAAGFLERKRATTHKSALRELEPYCLRVVEKRIVDEGDIVTARGVSSSIDLGLHLIERIAGTKVRGAIARQMDYPYRPSS